MPQHRAKLLIALEIRSGATSTGPSSNIASVPINCRCLWTAPTMISRSVGWVRAPQSIMGADRGSVELMRTVPRLRGLTNVNGNEGPLLKPVSWTEVALEV